VEELIIGVAVNKLVQLARNKSERSKWRRALLKVFIEISKAFKDDAEFAKAHDDVVLGTK